MPRLAFTGECGSFVIERDEAVGVSLGKLLAGVPSGHEPSPYVVAQM